MRCDVVTVMQRPDAVVLILVFLNRISSFFSSRVKVVIKQPEEKVFLKLQESNPAERRDWRLFA